MAIEYGKNKYNKYGQPSLDLVFTGPKKSLLDRVSGKSLQFTRNTIGTYVDANGIIQTAAAGEPRYTYDPVTGKELGLLVEESRTNLVTYSEDFNNAAWLKSNTTVTANNAVAPDGTSTADKVIEDSADSSHYVRTSVTVLPSTRYTYSIYAKAAERSKIKLSLGQSTAWGSPCSAIFDLNTGTVVSIQSATANVTASIQQLGNGWYRCVMSADRNANIAAGFAYAHLLDAAGVNPYQGDGTSGVYIWGCQISTGSFPTSYIPTSGSTVSRDPDTVTLTNDNLYNNSQFDIVNDPFGMSAGSDTLTLLPSAFNSSAIKRATVFSPNIAQSKINTFANKTDEFWRWRINATDGTFGLGSIYIGGPVTVDWGDGSALETITNGDNNTHTFAGGPGIYEVGFKGSNLFYTRFFYDAPNAVKVVAIGPAPENIRFDPGLALTYCSNLQSFDATVNTSLSTNMFYAFQSCSSLKSFPLLDTSSVTNFVSSWLNCTSLTSFPVIDTSSGTNFRETWRNCTNLTSFPSIDTSSGIDFFRTWQTCNNLTSFPLIDTSSGTNFNESWYNCTSLASFPSIDMSSGTNFVSSWRNCSSLTSFPLIDISSGTNFQSTWNGCSSLTTFPAGFFNSWNGTPANSCLLGTWTGCSALTSISVENIYNSISVSPSSSTPPASGKNIDVDYSTATGTPDITVSAIDLTAKGWTPTLNGTAQTDPYSFASLDLDFATNLTLNDNISNSNLITFTRGSTGTYVDSNGVIQTAAIDAPRFDHNPDTLESLGLLVEESRTNSMLNSNTGNPQYPASGVSHSTSVVGLDETTSATEVVITSTQGTTGLRWGGWSTSSTETRSFFVKVLSGSGVTITGQGGLGDPYTWNLSTKTYSSDSRHPTGGVYDYGNGWYKCWQGPTGTGGGTANYLVPVDVGTYLFWGFQRETGAFPTSYIPTPATFTSRSSTATYYDANGVIQNAAIDEARDDAYLPDENGNFVSAGLLLENAATNEITSSMPTSGGGGITNTSISGLPGVFETARKFTSSGGNDKRIILGSNISGVTFTYSFYAKLGTQGTSVFIRNGTGPHVTFNLSNQTINNNGLIANSEKMENVGNGWYRCSARAIGSGSSGFLVGVATGNALNSNAGDNMIVGGFQLERSSYPTSYIPTSGSTVTRAADVSSSSTVTRAADVASITGTNFSSWFNYPESTLYSEGVFIGDPYNGEYGYLATLDIGINDQRFYFRDRIGDSSDNITFQSTLSEVGTTTGNITVSIGANAKNTPLKYIHAIDVGVNAGSAVNGNVISTTNVLSGIQIPDRLQIGRHGAAYKTTCTISRLTYWPKRLTDTSLQYLTQ